MPFPAPLAKQPRHEVELLLALSRTRIGEAADHRIRTLLPELEDWTDFRRLVSVQEVAPLVWHHLVHGYASQLPGAVLREIRAEWEQFRLFALTRTMVLMDVLERLEGRGVSCIPLKGPVLAVQVYGTPFLRGFADLDLLVRERDVPAARDVLLEKSFERNYNPDVEASFIRQQYALEFSRGTVKVELHRALFPRVFAFPLDEEERLFACERTITVQGKQVRVLPAEQLLLYLCAHGAKHGWTSLRWICDVAELCHGLDAEEWERTLRLARRTRCRRILRLGAYLARALLDAPVPEALWLEGVRDATVLSLASRVSAKLTGPAAAPGDTPGTAGPQPGDEVESLRWWLAVREDPRDRAAYLARLVFLPTERDAAAMPFSRNLGPLRHVLRPMRLVLQAGRLFR